MYNNNYYVRDTKSNPETPVVMMVPSNSPIAIEGPPQQLETGGSTGSFGNPAVKRYDPTGLRSTMSTSQEALTENLKQYAPDHQPEPLWKSDAQDMLDEFKAK